MSSFFIDETWMTATVIAAAAESRANIVNVVNKNTHRPLLAGLEANGSCEHVFCALSGHL